MKLSPYQERLYAMIREATPPPDLPATSSDIARKLREAGRLVTGSHVVWAWKAGFIGRVEDTKPPLFFKKEA